MSVSEIDLRLGGRWRYALPAPDGSEPGSRACITTLRARRR
ncbi:hypothetical protein WMF30_27360 [Sorangium sp. So ce134]